MTTPKQTAAIARKKAKYPNRVDLAIEGRAQRERGELPKDHATPMLDRPYVNDLTAGLAPPPKRSQTIFRPTKLAP